MSLVLSVNTVQVDLVKREGASAQQQMIRVAEQLNGLHSFEQTFWVSALRAQGMAKLKDFLLERSAFPVRCSILFMSMKQCGLPFQLDVHFGV